ncbi:hypothetical protein PAHAL_3G249900 [Panicum hallii]|uniref:Uncharacterized protein n=1 Tax=Panicum hallii TaxID=206008 RepID=A0A2T8KJ90_9POAL|nr:hypothetical protein PAHAL_3G249900 [Panicum hallii]
MKPHPDNQAQNGGPSFYTSSQSYYKQHLMIHSSHPSIALHRYTPPNLNQWLTDRT